MNANDIRAALRARYSDHRRYATAEEVGLTTGFSHRRLDMMVLDCYNSNGFRIDGFEIKVSTSDLRRELEDPEKHIAFFDVIDYYTLAAPNGVIEPLMDIIPKKWGILIVDENGSTRYKRKPLALEDRKADKPVPRAFLASITRAIQGKQPSEQELRAAYERGRKDEKESDEWRTNYMRERVQKEADKIEKYDNLLNRLHIWRSDNIEEAIKEFEAFRNLHLSWIFERIDATINDLTALSLYLKGANNEQDEDRLV